MSVLEWIGIATCVMAGVAFVRFLWRLHDRVANNTRDIRCLYRDSRDQWDSIHEIGRKEKP